MSIKININYGYWIMDGSNYIIINCSISNCINTLSGINKNSNKLGI